jgi:hypothetical protein
VARSIGVLAGEIGGSMPLPGTGGSVITPVAILAIFIFSSYGNSFSKYSQVAKKSKNLNFSFGSIIGSLL